MKTWYDTCLNIAWIRVRGFKGLGLVFRVIRVWGFRVSRGRDCRFCSRRVLGGSRVV